jgi:large subunit ribosomal protein L10
MNIVAAFACLAGRFFVSHKLKTRLWHKNPEERRTTLLAISKERKNELVKQYVDLIGQTNGFVIVQYRGLGVTEIDVLRAQVREAGGRYLVTKNTIFTKALQEIGWPVPDDLLSGPVAVAFGMENLPGVAKAVLDFTGERHVGEKMEVTGGIMTGEILDAAKVKAVSNLPTMDEIRAQLAGLVVAPATGLVSVINAATGQIVNVVQAYLDDREEGDGEAA